MNSEKVEAASLDFFVGETKSCSGPVKSMDKELRTFVVSLRGIPRSSRDDEAIPT